MKCNDFPNVNIGVTQLECVALYYHHAVGVTFDAKQQ